MDDLYVNPILIGAAIPIFIWLLIKLYQAKNAKEKADKEKSFPVDRRNKEKEIELLADLLQDIKDNTHAWTYTNYNMSSMTSASIINDVKNIAIVIGQNSQLRTTSSLAVSYGLKDITQYSTHSPDNVCTHIQGRHVTDFCIQVEDCLDTRGLELDHFKEQIKSKL